MRRNNALPVGQLFNEFRPNGQYQTYAAWPVWSGSRREEVRFGRMAKKQAIKIYHQARQWNRQRQKGRYGGALGSAALRVLESLIFDFLNFASGRLDPSYAALARKTGLGRSTVATALARLKELGIVTWLRRCTESKDAQGRFMLRQETNAYAVLPPSQWHGYMLPPEPPQPHPSEWGVAPPFGSRAERYAQAVADGISPQRFLEREDHDGLFAALARLGRTLGAA